MRELYACIRHGIIRHYFFQSFNLLSIKLTPEAQSDLLKIFCDLIYADIRMDKPLIYVLWECKSLRGVCSKLTQRVGNWTYSSINISNLMENDTYLMVKVSDCLRLIKFSQSLNVLILLANTLCSSPLISFVKRIIFLKWNVRSLIDVHQDQSNKRIYTMCRRLKKNVHGIDISTSKIWYVMFLFRLKDFRSALSILNEVLSRIPPFWLFPSLGDARNKSTATKALYTNTFSDMQTLVTERARSAWLLNLYITKHEIKSMPPGIQIELSHCDPYLGVILSPYTCAFYMTFLCHHELQEFEQRDNALRQLIDITNDPEQIGPIPHHS